MANRVMQPSQIGSYQGTGTIARSSRQTRPRWFDGRFLAAHDLERDQSYFLRRQAELGRAAGSGVVHGLQVSTVSTNVGAIVIRVGQGLTPGGNLVMLANDLTVDLSDIADAEDLEVQFGLSTSPTPVARTRTGLFIVALRPVQFTANPITSYPVSIQGTRTAHDGNIVEATAVSLVPWAVPASSSGASADQAALARQIFVLGSEGSVSDSLLPLAMVSLQRNVIEWMDQWMVRRDSGPESGGLRRGLNGPATQQAYLQQYDAQLQLAVNPLVQRKAAVRFAATDYFQALPPAGRFPLGAIDTTAFTQLFFPPQTDVLLSLVPDDELPAVLEDGMSLPPIDLTQPASAYADLAVFALVPVPRQGFAALAATLQPVQLTAAVPQVLNNRKPLDLLRFYRSPVVRAAAATSWESAIGSQTYGYYVRRRSAPIYLSLASVAVTAVPSQAAGAFTLTASVSPETATGTVTFMDGSTSLGVAGLMQGSGSVAITGLAAGTHGLSAVYSGDAKLAPCTSALLEQTV